MSCKVDNIGGIGEIQYYSAEQIIEQPDGSFRIVGNPLPKRSRDGEGIEFELRRHPDNCVCANCTLNRQIINNGPFSMCMKVLSAKITHEPPIG